MIILLMIILTGCDVYPIFVGESDNWEGEFSTLNKSENNCDKGNYTLHFKEGSRDSEFYNIEVVIGGGKLKIEKEKLKGSTFQFSGCAWNYEDQEIEVTIKWDDVNEENFLLKKK